MGTVHDGHSNWVDQISSVKYATITASYSRNQSIYLNRYEVNGPYFKRH